MILWEESEGWSVDRSSSPPSSSVSGDARSRAQKRRRSKTELCLLMAVSFWGTLMQSQPRERLCIPSVTAVCSFIIRCAPPPVAPLPHLKYFLFLHLFIPSASNSCKISHQNFNLLLFSSYLKFLFLSVRVNLTWRPFCFLLSLHDSLAANKDIYINFNIMHCWLFLIKYY